MALYTTLQNRILDLEKTKTTQDNKTASLKRSRSRTHRLKRLYKVGLTARVESSDNKESLGEDTSKQGRIDAIDADEEIILVSVHDVNVFAGEEVFVTEQDVDDITLAQALEEMKSTKPKHKGVVIQDLDQIRLDEETAKYLQAEFDEEERLTREKAEKEEEANIALIKTWDDIQAKINADHQLAERMQAQEQEELSIKERSTIFQQLLEKRRKHFAAKRAEKKRNKPPTKDQQRKIIAFKRVNTFEDFRTELVKGKEKRAETKLAQEITKKQKVEDDKEIIKIKKLMEIIPDEEEIAIDAIPLAVKSLRRFGTLYKLVKAEYESTRPVEDLDLVLWNGLKTMFKPHVEDNVWKNQQDYKVLSWKLYDSCGVHFLRMQHMQIYMLVEKKYPLTPSTLTMMLEKKLMIDYESEMAYQLLKFIIKQLKK
ncbi:hypothetical protein Tco_0924616 [Tanacetum coccineum]|uniref:Uncharacterized protein n=1 Tax=Tanacetum coccineum TaxID=301880 RepID=A0ABQ5D5F7_9ASTR